MKKASESQKGNSKKGAVSQVRNGNSKSEGKPKNQLSSARPRRGAALTLPDYEEFLMLASKLEVSTGWAVAMLNTMATQLLLAANYFPAGSPMIGYILELNEDAFHLVKELELKASGLVCSLETVRLEAIKAEGAR